MTVMKSIVRSALMLLLLAIWAVAIAQAQPVEEPPAAAAADEQVLEELPGESAAGTEADKEEESAVQASPEDVFRPGDEISEDYPVPLPADI
jgi:hypothetical protein